MSIVRFIFFLGIPFCSVSFRASELALSRNSECLGMSTFFRGIIENIPSLFRGIFSERNSVPNPTSRPLSEKSVSKICGNHSFGSSWGHSKGFGEQHVQHFCRFFHQTKCASQYEECYMISHSQNK